VPGAKLNDPQHKHDEPRRWYAAAAWVILITVLWGTDLFVKFAEHGRYASGKDDFRLVVEQITSGLAVLVMIPFVLRWLRVFPLRRDAWIPAIVGHTAGSMLFATGHYVLMVSMRSVVYAFSSVSYIWREPFVGNLLVEYQKDIKVYIGIIAAVSAWQFYWRRHSSRSGTSSQASRLVVQTGSGTAILRFEQIDYLEAARNYVSVHADGREYVLRDTMANLEDRLPAETFARTHRSYIVNIDKIREIRSVDSANRIVLGNGTNVPLSRGYQERLRSLLDN